jgi:hypothetical protein
MVIHLLQMLSINQCWAVIWISKEPPPSSSLKLFQNQTTIGSGSLKKVQNQKKTQSHHNRIDSFHERINNKPMVIWTDYFDSFQKFENHGYISEPGLWFCWELWLWILIIVLITVRPMYPFLITAQHWY